MKSILYLTLALVFAVQAQTISPATQKRLDALKQGYEAAAVRQVGPAYDSAVKALDAKYLAALDRLSTSATQAGRLEDAIALRDEKKRVTDALPLPESDAEAPELLKPLRGTYRDQLAALETNREKNLAPLKERYLEELAKLQTEATKAGQLEDALAVRAVIEELQPVAQPGAVSSANDGKLVIAKGNGKTDAKAAQAICEWALANGAVVETDQGTVGANEKLKSVPKGRFVVREIKAEQAVRAFPWELLASLPELGALSLNVLEPITPLQTKMVASLPMLTDLVLTGQLTVAALQALPLNTRLDELGIHGTTGSEPLASAVDLLATRFPAIQKLHWGMDGSALSTEECKAFCAWKRLKHLTTRGDLSTPVIEALAETPAIESLLCLGNGTLDPASIPKLKKLVFLNARYGKHKPGLVDAVAELPLLVTLRVPLHNCRSGDVLPLARLKNLRNLSLVMAETSSTADEFTPFLSSLTELLELDLYAASTLTDAGLKHLEKLKKLQRLTLEGAVITDAGLAEFRKAVPKCNIIR